MKNFKLNAKELKIFTNVSSNVEKLSISKWKLAEFVQGEVDKSDEINTFAGMVTKIVENDANVLPDLFTRAFNTVKGWSRFTYVTLDELSELNYSENKLKAYVTAFNAKKCSDVATFLLDAKNAKAIETAKAANEKQEKDETTKASEKNAKASVEFEAFKKSAAFKQLEDFRYKNADTFKAIMAEYVATL